MGLFSDIGNALSDAGNTVGNIAGDVGHAVEGAVSGAGHLLSHITHEILYHPALDAAVIAGVIGGPEAAAALWPTLSGGQPAPSGLSSLFSGTTSLLGQITGGIKNAISGAFGTTSSVFGNVLSGINGFIDSAGKSLAGIIDPIKHALDEVTHTAQNLNDHLIQPVVGPLTTLISQTEKLNKEIHGEIHGSLADILKIPGQIADSLTSVDAQFARATQELGMQNQAIAENTLVPGLNRGQLEASKHLTDHFLTHEGGPEEGATFQEQLKLGFYGTANDAEASVRGFLGWLQQDHGMWNPLIWMVWHILLEGDAITNWLDLKTKELAQEVNKDYPIELLAPAQAIEAERRGLISHADMEESLARQGYHTDRRQVLYDLAQFLFGPREAVELHARGIIDEGTLDQLMAQNNLDSGQKDSLIQLMDFLFTIKDANVAYLRGEIDQSTWQALLRANRVPDRYHDTTLALAKAVLDPSELVAAQGREGARNEGLLADTLNSKAPDAVLEAYQHAQKPPSQAELDWLMHWAVPGASWWINAFFRGLRTRTEVYAALEALNVPREIWDDMFGVEEELPPVWLVPDVVGSGVWTEAEAVPTLEKLGFSEANAKVLYEYGRSKGKASKAATADGLQKLSLSNARKLYDDGAIPGSEYQQILTDHGYGPEAAQLTVELADIEAAITQRKTFAKDLVNQVKLGAITRGNAVSQLYEHGYTSAEVDKYALDIEKAKVEAFKLPTRSELDHMLKKGIVTQAEWLSTMEAMGYSQGWAERLLLLVEA